MKNRRAFARQETSIMVVFSSESTKCVGEIREVGLGGIRARLPKKHFQTEELVNVSPQNGIPLEYQVAWLSEVGAGCELGLKFPNSISIFWQSWAADVLANTRPTNAEVLERRGQIRLGCELSGSLKVKRKQTPVKVLDVGGGGALVECAEEFPEGCNAQFTIKNPVRVGHVPCRVVRVWQGRPTRLGLEFVGLRERHRLALTRLLDLLYRRAE